MYAEADANPLPQNMDYATAWTSVCFNTPIYLSYLVSRCAKAGVTFKRGVVAHVADAPRFHSSGRADCVVNCTGLGARTLGGVQDATMQPIRGQTVLVRNEPATMSDTSSSDDGADEMCYVMGRPVGGGTILGGCYQPGNTDPEVDVGLAGRIMRRAVELCPSLVS